MGRSARVTGSAVCPDGRRFSGSGEDRSGSRFADQAKVSFRREIGDRFRRSLKTALGREPRFSSHALLAALKHFEWRICAHCVWRVSLQYATETAGRLGCTLTALQTAALPGAV